MTTAAPVPGGAAYAGNNIYGNAAFTGACAGMCAGRVGTSTKPALSAANIAAARAFAVEVDSLITATDAQVTTGGDVTQLAITTNTIAANEQWKAGLLLEICKGAWSGSTGIDATAADYASLAAGCVAAWAAAGVQLTTP